MRTRYLEDFTVGETFRTAAFTGGGYVGGNWDSGEVKTVFEGPGARFSGLMSDGAWALEEVLAEHKAIYTAIRERAPDAARAAMRAHIEHSRERLFGGGLFDLSL